MDRVLRFYVLALLFTGIFFVCASLMIDAATYFLGKPWRGVSYGIGVYYLNISLVCVAGITLIGTRWFGGGLSLLIGVPCVFLCVAMFFPQPLILVRLSVASLISILLIGLILRLVKMTAD